MNGSTIIGAGLFGAGIYAAVVSALIHLGEATAAGQLVTAMILLIGANVVLYAGRPR